MNLHELMLDQNRFLCGVELVTTRGTLAEERAMATRRFAAELTRSDRVDWVSITDNAGGNPQLSPMALGTPILYGGKEVLIHLSCKDFNRNGLESHAWQLASEGFNNLLTLSGDYPTSGYAGQSKPVFDIDSVGLLTLLRDMNRGLTIPNRPGQNGSCRKLQSTQFVAGAVVSNFKLYEREVIPQYLKLEKKLHLGAEFIIAQIGYDTRKSHELQVYLRHCGHAGVPLIGNVFLLNARVADFFHRGMIPGVVVSDALNDECARQARSPDKGHAFFVELAAKQVAIFRGLGYHGVYLGGINGLEPMLRILDRADSFSSDDWRQFAREISYSRPGEFFLYALAADTGLVDPERLNPECEESLRHRAPGSMDLTYRLSRCVHDTVFTPGTPLFRVARSIYSRAKDRPQGPAALRMVERMSKALLFGCQDCGDCSLPDIAYLCPEASCAKNQRNGPCGGTRDGKCEVTDSDCIWARAYDRLKADGHELQMLDHAPVIQDHSLRGTSSWANTFLGQDHRGRSEG
jgi:methylenetetrahydrofolate reductase (NADPH)